MTGGGAARWHTIAAVYLPAPCSPFARLLPLWRPLVQRIVAAGRMGRKLVPLRALTSFAAKATKSEKEFLRSLWLGRSGTWGGSQAFDRTGGGLELLPAPSVIEVAGLMRSAGLPDATTPTPTR